VDFDFSVKMLRALLAGMSDELAALYVERVAVFGSVARGEAGASSDVDLLVRIDEARLLHETGRRLSLFHVAKVQAFLDDRLGVPVGLVLERSASDSFLRRIDPELQRVA
jgi:predicted nucleotidyltransferase